MTEKVTSVQESYTNLTLKLSKSVKIRLERLLTHLYETRDERLTQSDIIESALDKHLKKFGY
jgi:hypothetical protein